MPLNQLGDSPVSYKNNHVRRADAAPPPRNEAPHSPGVTPNSARASASVLELGEDTRSGSRHARLRAVLPQPREARCHVGIPGDDRGFEIVRSLPREKGVF